MWLPVQEISGTSPIITVTGSYAGGPVGACTKGPYTITEGSPGPTILFDNVRAPCPPEPASWHGFTAQ